MPALKLASAKALQLLHERKLLPAFPDILTRLDEAVANPRSSLDVVVSIVAADILLASRVMRSARSVRYGLTSPKSLLEAVARLGIAEVRAIAFAVAYTASFVRPEHIRIREFWQHAFVSAVATRVLSEWLTHHRQQPVCDSATAFLLGLSHDMGVLLLALLDTEAYAKVVESVGEGKDQLFAEQYHLGTTHALMSAALMHHWRFSDQLSMALAGHHYPVRLQLAVQPWADLALLGEAMAVSLGYANGVYVGCSSIMQEVIAQRREALSLPDSVWHEIGVIVSSQLQDEGWLEIANGV